MWKNRKKQSALEGIKEDMLNDDKYDDLLMYTSQGVYMLLRRNMSLT